MSAEQQQKHSQLLQLELMAADCSSVEGLRRKAKGELAALLFDFEQSYGTATSFPKFRRAITHQREMLERVMGK